jgi:NAD+ synthase (glutamine-hydrolysing)
MKTRIVQIEVLPGRPHANTERILQHVASARADGIQLVVFSEMAIPGYILGDEWERPAFLRECERCGAAVRDAAREITIVFGNVGIDWDRRNEDGRVRKYNALFVAEAQRFIGPEGGPYEFVIKTLLPNYREFDDSRHFFDLRKLALEEGRPVESLIQPVKTSLATLGCILCEDAWDMDYSISPLDELQKHAADIYINISASPYTFNKNHKRNRVFSERAKRLGRPLLYVNHVGIQNNGKTVYTFDGASCVYDGQGGHLESDPLFEETSLTVDLPPGSPARVGKPLQLRDDDIGTLARAIRYGTAKFMDLCSIERITVGVSGGIDSAVVAALYSQLLDPKDLLVVNMPSRFNSTTTRDLALDLSKRLGCYYAEIPIEDSLNLTRSQMEGLDIRAAGGTHSRKLSFSPLHLENIQARDRSSRILAAISGAFGGTFTCNANKSEVTVGYTTLYGDLGGYLANLADLWKTEVYALARHLNGSEFDSPVIPDGILDIVPSAELSSEQNVDEGKGDPLVYPYHDLLFKSWVERWERAAPEDILEWYRDGCLEKELGYEGNVAALFGDHEAFITDLERWWKLYQGMGLVKRIQAPPILAVKKRAFGFDHRESFIGATFTQRYESLKTELLG